MLKENSAYTQKNNVDDISFYAELSAAENIEDFKSNVHNLVKKTGFSDFLLKVITREDVGVLTSFSPVIYNKYLTGYSAYNNLLMQHLKTDNSPVFLSQIIDFANQSPINTNIFQFSCSFYENLKSYNFNDCYCISRKPEINGKKVLFILADKERSKDDFYQKVESNRAILHLLGESIAVVGRLKFPEYSFLPNANSISITPKPLRLLNVIAKDNITLKAAARQLNISLDTANKHIAAAKTALGAKTLTSTVYKAIKEGIVEIED